ncbi:MAG: hypothetical protein ABEK12_04095 [Candidatus Nanohaloarchaea archaeon]
MPWSTVLDRFLTLILFPAANPEFIPTLIPIGLGLVTIELYFGKYAFEDLGWNSAVSNSVLIIATATTLIVRLNLLDLPPAGPRALVAYGILVLGLAILLLNFYHVWPPEIAFNVSSGFVAYTTVYLAIVTVYTGIPIDGSTAAAWGIFALGLYVLFKLLKRLPGTAEPRRGGW